MNKSISYWLEKAKTAEYWEGYWSKLGNKTNEEMSRKVKEIALKAIQLGLYTPNLRTEL